jgi:hypothetical protein
MPAAPAAVWVGGPEDGLKALNTVFRNIISDAKQKKVVGPRKTRLQEFATFVNQVGAQTVACHQRQATLLLFTRLPAHSHPNARSALGMTWGAWAAHARAYCN